MATITCPWCEEDQIVTFALFEEPEASFTCADCGTSVAFVEDPPEPLDLAA